MSNLFFFFYLKLISKSGLFEYNHGTKSSNIHCNEQLQWNGLPSKSTPSFALKPEFKRFEAK